MFSYLYCTFPVYISEYVSRNLQLCISEFPAMYLGIIPLLISNYSDILIEIIPLLITEFLNVYRICYYPHIICILFGVMVRALNAKMKVMGLNPEIHGDYYSEQLCTVQQVVDV
jgi:hypothetical protein